MDGLRGTIPYGTAEEELQEIDWFGMLDSDTEKETQPRCLVHNWTGGGSVVPAGNFQHPGVYIFLPTGFAVPRLVGVITHLFANPQGCKNLADTRTEEEWLKWAFRAFGATYGYEFQGDNLLISRVNLLMTFEEYLWERWRRKPTRREHEKAAKAEFQSQNQTSSPVSPLSAKPNILHFRRPSSCGQGSGAVSLSLYRCPAFFI